MKRNIKILSLKISGTIDDIGLTNKTEAHLPHIIIIQEN